MNHLRKICVAIILAAVTPVFAGGILTNTNQNLAFNRMMSREGSIGIDGVYYNPAGVAFLKPGNYLSLGWQMASQSRTIENDYHFFTNNTQNPTTPREFRGTAFAPVLPSIQYAHNWERFSVQANFGVIGGGGKCTFNNGLGSFEKIVAETAHGAVGLAEVLDNALGQYMFTTDAMFGTDGKYSYDAYMRGRSYYYGLSVAGAYKLTDNLAVSAGVRGVYVLTNYFGYVRDIKVGNMPLYMVLDPSKTNAANIELNCEQSGTGFTPIIGVDFKLKHWNFSAKYEFKTRIRLKNESVNQAPSIGNLSNNLEHSIAEVVKTKAMEQRMPEKQATDKGVTYAKQILTNPDVVKTMTGLKEQFDTKLAEATGEFADGAKIAADIPALLTLGVGYTPVDALRINAGFHYFYDRQATSYNHREDKLKRGTIEWNAGVEYDASKLITVSAGWQNTNYGLTDEYMDDKSFVVSSNSVGAGAVMHLTKKMDLNLAYFHTFYGHKKTAENVELKTIEKTESGIKYNTVNEIYSADYTRNNNVWAVGIDIKF
ncbi:MAG: hypothetical protein E7104_04065 [Prevotella sp.]|jgi:long-chain fatty acid transport protein|nr:hypothetical protein [Prevotella sp.]